MIDFPFYRSIAIRRLPLFLLISLAAAGFAVYVAMKLPPRYASTARLLVESAQISGQLVESTVNVDANEQLQIFQQRLMTRENLLDIARKYNVYPDLATLPADRIVSKMRGDTSIVLQSGRDRATFMVMSFTADSPQIAAGVLNEYVTQILNENAKFRKTRATDTLDFFRNEVDRLNKELEDQSAKILVFQTDNKDALPSTLDYRLSRQSQIIDTMNRNNQNKVSLEDQKRRIQQLYNATGASSDKKATQTPDELELSNLEDQLSQSLLIYTPQNPKVKLLQARVDALRKKVAAATEVGDSSVSRNETLMRIQLEGIDQQITDLDAQNTTLQKELDRLTATIEKTPSNKIALDALDREYNILESQYNAAVSRMNTASAGERVEVLSKGQRVTVVDQPSVPDVPTSPNRKKIAVGGTVLGIALASILIVVLELLNSSVRRPVDLTQRFGISPLAVLPIVQTPADRFIKQATVLGIVAVWVLGVPLALFLIHTYYLPLDLIASKAIQRLGI